MNHPVHVISEDNQMSPSSFIPFCEFGGDPSAVGVKIDNFQHPVCKIFQAKVLNNQLCYEVDLKKFSNKDNIDKELELGFTFLMDYNEDRQITFDEKLLSNPNGLTSSVENSYQREKAITYFDTIGICFHSS